MHEESFEIKNATIRSTMLGIEDHEIMTAYLQLDYGGSGQGFGGYGFSSFNKDTNKMIPNKYGTQFIMRVLEVVGVKKWEDLKGKHIRVESSHTKITKIGNIIEDKWYNPSEEMKGSK